jgi:hypothetical protein
LHLLKKKQILFLLLHPLCLNTSQIFYRHFKALDFLVLQGITAASVQKRFHNMCNGANLAYERKAFFEVNGFTGIDHIASGDDMLFMQKIAQHYPWKDLLPAIKRCDRRYTSSKNMERVFSASVYAGPVRLRNYNDIKIFCALFPGLLF